MEKLWTDTGIVTEAQEKFTAKVQQVEQGFNITLGSLVGQAGSAASVNYGDTAALQQKIAEAAADPQLAKHLPATYLGPDGKSYDKFGNIVQSVIESQKQATKFYDASFLNLVKQNLGMKEPFSPGKVIPVEKYDDVPGTPFMPAPKYKVNDDQLLIQRIGVESNLNVTIQKFVMKSGMYVSGSGDQHRLFCNVCKAFQNVPDPTMFVASKEGLIDELAGFCRQHRHTDTPVVSVKTPAIIAKPVGRKFRED